MSVPKVKHVRASVVRGGGGDYHDVDDGHWIDDHIATPMARYPEYRQSRRSFGINVLGTLVVEIEADDGTIGFAITTAGEIGAFIVEKHLARFIEGRPITDIEKAWDQMYFSTQYYGRRGIVVNAISAVDLAMWDLLAKWRKSRCMPCSAAPSGTNSSSMRPGLGPTSLRSSASSAARCHCSMAQRRVRKGSRRLWPIWRICGTGWVTTSGSCSIAG